MRFVLRKAVLFFLFAAIFCCTTFLISCDSMTFTGYVGGQGQPGKQGGRGEKGDPGKPGTVITDDDEDEGLGEVSFYIFLPEHNFIFCS